MTALWIANVEITDADEYAKYVPIAGEVIAEHGGVFLARGGAYVQLEGRDRPRNVVARFPSVEAAVACYNSEKYQSAVVHAKAGSKRDIVIVEETG
ncbi:MAG: DUF1330 domain-containing protein [Paracoccaceae bacterium]|nr:DUF1330 domain-containing protein [Paracoccaceae bacterium]